MREKIVACAKRFDADLVGFAPASRFASEDPLFQIMPNVKTVIGLGFRVLRGIYRGVEEGTTYYQYTTMGVENLDETVMQRAADQFVGTHDFRAVRSVGTETKTTVRTVYYFDITRDGDMIECKVCANGFLYNMVRAMVGTVVYAAEGKLDPDDIPAILESGNRTLAGPTVPPGGLYMTKLWYNEDVL